MKEMTDEHAPIRLKGGANYRIIFLNFKIVPDEKNSKENNMNKKWYLFLAVIMITALALTACAPKEAAAPAEAPAEAPACRSACCRT